jgi:ABC-type sugar transport system ATPase subunit
MKVLAASTPPTAEDHLRGEPASIMVPQAQQLGISIVHQEPLLSHNLTVAENILLRNQRLFTRLIC